MNKPSLFMTLLGASLLGLLVACEQQGPMEKAGENIDEAAEAAGESMEEAGDEVEDAAEEAADKADETMDNMSN